MHVSKSLITVAAPGKVQFPFRPEGGDTCFNHFHMWKLL